MKSTLTNMILVLLAVCLITSAALGVVYKVTEEPIAVAKQQKTEAALKRVVPEFDANSLSSATIDGVEVQIYTATSAGEVVGYAVESYSDNGFSGRVKLMVGIVPDGTIYNIEVLEQGETPGLGANMTKADNNLVKSFKSKIGSQMTMKVRKDGGDVDALTAATISSRAYTEAVATAFKAFEQLNNK